MVRIGMTLSQLVSLVRMTLNHLDIKLAFITKMLSSSTHAHAHAHTLRLTAAGSSALPCITKYDGIPNIYVPLSLSLCLSVPPQNEKNGEMTTNVFMNLVRAWKHSSSSPSLAPLLRLLSPVCSVARPSNGLVTFYNHKWFLASSGLTLSILSLAPANQNTECLECLWQSLCQDEWDLSDLSKAGATRT